MLVKLKLMRGMASNAMVRQPRCDQWPEGADNDRLVWRDLTSESAPLRFDHVRRYSPYTLTARERIWGEFLLWLDAAGELRPDDQPSARLTPSRLTRYILERQRRAADAGRPYAPYTTYMHFLGLYRMCRMFDPAGDFGWVRMHPLRPRGSLQFVKSKRIPDIDFLALRRRLNDQLDEALSTVCSRRTAATCRDLALCSLLSVFPLRLNNLSRLAIGRHVLVDGHSVAIRISARETKSGEGGGLRLPPQLAINLVRYIELARPYLAKDDPSPRLWMTAGRPFSRRAIQDVVRKIINRLLGESLGPHAFRHLAARHLLRDLREGPTQTQAVLCHSSPLTLDWYHPDGPPYGLDLWLASLSAGSQKCP